MPANECIPFFEPGARITGRCTAAVTGKRLVSVSATPTGGLAGTENIRVAHCPADDRPVGVAAYDGALNEEIPLLNGPGMIVPVTAGAAVAAGDELKSDASGQVIPWVTSGVVVGQAMADAASGADCAVRLTF